MNLSVPQIILKIIVRFLYYFAHILPLSIETESTRCLLIFSLEVFLYYDAAQTCQRSLTSLKEVKLGDSGISCYGNEGRG